MPLLICLSATPVLPASVVGRGPLAAVRDYFKQKVNPHPTVSQYISSGNLHFSQHSTTPSFSTLQGDHRSCWQNKFASKTESHYVFLDCRNCAVFPAKSEAQAPEERWEQKVSGYTRVWRTFPLEIQTYSKERSSYEGGASLTQARRDRWLSRYKGELSTGHLHTKR